MEIVNNVQAYNNELINDALSGPLSDDSVESFDKQDELKYARFNKDNSLQEKELFNSIEIKHTVNDYGWNYYIFDDATTQYLSLIVFESNNHTLINTNGTLIPLNDFLNITTCTSTRGKLIFKTSSGKKVSIPNATVHVVMKAISHLSSIYNVSESDNSSFLQSILNPSIFLVGIASFLTGLYINGSIQTCHN